MPPFVALAFRVTLVPAHTGFADAVIETPTGNNEPTAIVTAFDKAGVPVAQSAFEVS